MPLMASGRRSASDQDDSSDEEMKQVEEKPGEEEEEEEEGEGEDGEEEEYVVEKILDHKYEDGILKYKVKWKGYEKKSDQTWEPEDTLEEVVALEEYLQEIGGRPSQTPGKRGRKSTGGASTPAPKKTRVKQETAGEDEWDPPAGSWEDDVRMIETLERNGGDHICYIQWVNGRRSQHPLHVVYQRCPQKMLKFYESHLVFRDSAGTIKTAPQ
ncbi:hypothetical protein TWF788_000856 [Orbilia oligospora]|uniref:Chromo domain-containing protein n=1 Tax=Orbilia oligospora TaxID=2813651 RepID=A0A6G1LZS4_ORBOL|nr:hypothetical protein TWF788_000856 [Orbilia oligospora]KAF3219729.1 hypothetical protein TWF191_007701 [Orbilia oligospora]KAF3237696.1 hypothetical protein TWF192_010805 [Orbilia oligospora]